MNAEKEPEQNHIICKLIAASSNTSVRLRLILLKLHKIFDKSSVVVSSDSSLPTTTGLPLSRSSIVDSLQQFIRLTIFQFSTETN